MSNGSLLPKPQQLRRLVPRPLHPAARQAYLQIGVASSRLRMLPSFLVIGGQRCGTTTIFKTLAAHPQIVRPPVEKGTDYYSLHHGRGLDWYQGHFPLAATARALTRGAGEPVAFEACTYYLFHPLAAERIAADFPNIRLVVMLRDPVARAWSAYNHEFARRFETVPSFERALDLEPERLAGEVERIRAEPGYRSFAHRHHAYLSRGQYAEQLERVFAHFPREQVLVLDSEAFFADPAGEFTRLTDYLGLGRWLPDRFERENARPGASMTDRVRRRLEQHYAPYDEHLADLLGREPGWRRRRG